MRIQVNFLAEYQAESENSIKLLSFTTRRTCFSCKCQQPQISVDFRKWKHIYLRNGRPRYRPGLARDSISGVTLSQRQTLPTGWQEGCSGPLLVQLPQLQGQQRELLPVSICPGPGMPPNWSNLGHLLIQNNDCCWRHSML